MVQEQNLGTTIEAIQKEFNVPQGMDGEIRVKKAEVPQGQQFGAAAAFEFGLYYGVAGTASETWQKYSEFEVPMVIVLTLPEGIDGSRKVKVHYFADGSSVGEEVYNELADDGKSVMFIADSFSIYVVSNEKDLGEPADTPDSGSNGNGNVTTNDSVNDRVISPHTGDKGGEQSPRQKGIRGWILFPVAAAALSAAMAFYARYIRRKKED